MDKGKSAEGMDDGTGVRHGEEKQPQGRKQEGQRAREVMAEGEGQSQHLGGGGG